MTESVLEDMVRKRKLRPHEEIKFDEYYKQYKQQCVKEKVDYLNRGTVIAAIKYWHSDWVWVNTGTKDGFIFKRKVDC